MNSEPITITLIPKNEEITMISLGTVSEKLEEKLNEISLKRLYGKQIIHPNSGNPLGAMEEYENAYVISYVFGGPRHNGLDRVVKEINITADERSETTEYLIKSLSEITNYFENTPDLFN